MQKYLPKSQCNLLRVVWLCVICCFFLVDNVNAQMTQKMIQMLANPRIHHREVQAGVRLQPCQKNLTGSS